MAVRAVIFDWGGTLTPWHTVDHDALWREVCAPHFPAARADQVAAAIVAAEHALWQLTEDAQRSATLTDVFEQAGITPTEALLASYFEAWDPHTFTDPDAGPLLRDLRERGIKVGVLSNTMWPRSAHERVFRRDGVLDLIDGRRVQQRDPVDQAASGGVPGRDGRGRGGRPGRVRVRG